MSFERATEYFPCPHCGADVEVTAKFCRECGADDKVGWSDSYSTDDENDDAYEDDFDYDEYLRKEFPDQATPKPKNYVTITVIILLCLGMLLASM